MKVDIYKKDGTKTGESIDLSEQIFGIDPNDHVIYLAVKAHLANRRQGTHKTKERSEVRGGGRKPWKQKGRGGARAGTSRSPLWVGGGTIFGPKPHSYRQKLNKKVKQLAVKSAFSHKAKAEQIKVIEDFNFETPKTKDFADILRALKIYGKKTLLLTSETLETVYKSGRNIEKVKIMEANKANAYDVLNNQVLLVQKSAIEVIEKTLN
ncbi:MAG: 50S ribosomal protein L4 [Chlorobi bacterium]|nr:50S ribosomal protein L4 [Chlorobiota bacterium]